LAVAHPQEKCTPVSFHS